MREHTEIVGDEQTRVEFGWQDPRSATWANWYRPSSTFRVSIYSTIGRLRSLKRVERLI